MPDDRKPPLLKVTAVTAGYRRMQVLWGVDLAIRERESIVLLGANGAGKTTLLKAIMRLVDIWAGRIEFAGEDITALRTNQRVRRGIVFMSETSGFPGSHHRGEYPHRRAVLVLEDSHARTDATTFTRCFPRSPSAGGRRPAACRAVSARCWGSGHRQSSRWRSAPLGDGRALCGPVATSSRT